MIIICLNAFSYLNQLGNVVDIYIKLCVFQWNQPVILSFVQQLNVINLSWLFQTKKTATIFEINSEWDKANLWVLNKV